MKKKYRNKKKPDHKQTKHHIWPLVFIFCLWRFDFNKILNALNRLDFAIEKVLSVLTSFARIHQHAVNDS